MNKKLKTTIKVIALTILIAILSFSCLLLYIENSNKLEFKDTNLTKIAYNINRPEDATKDTIKVEVDKLFGNTSYRLIECDLEYPTRGHADILTRKIKVDKDLSLEYFAFVLTHELVHIKYFTKGERFCNLKAFELLYNSENDYLKNIALMFAHYDILGAFEEEYSFTGYIENFLQNHLTM